METLLRKISRLILSYHKSIVFAFTFLTVISFITIFKMEIKADIIDVLPKGNDTVVQFKEFMEKYGAMDTVSVVVESENNVIEEHTDLIENLSEKLKGSPLIEYVDYSPFTFRNEFFIKHFPLFLDEKGLKQLQERLLPAGIEQQVRLNRQKLISPLGSPIDSELISMDPLNMREITMGSLKRSHKDDSLDLGAGYYFTKDHSTALIFVKPKGKSKDMAFVKKFKKELDAIVFLSLKESNNPTDVKIRLAGGHILSEEVRQVIRHDIISSSVLSIVLIALLIWIAYRVRWAVLASIGFTMLASLSMTLSFAYLMFGSLNIVTSIVAAVLIGLYVDYSIHMVKRYGNELQKCNDRQKALEITLTKTGSAIVISAFTTSLSFFTILITKFEGLYELGLASGIGVLLCLLSALFLMSSLLVWISKDGAQKIVPAKEPSFGVEGLINLVTRKPRTILFASVVLTVILGLGIIRLSFDNDPENVGIKDSQTLAAIKAISQKTNKKNNPLQIIIKGKNTAELTAAFDSVEKLLFNWKKDGLIGKYDSLNIFLPAPHIQKANIGILHEITGRNKTDADRIEKIMTGALEKNNLDYEKHYIKTYLNGIVTALNHQEPAGIEELNAVSDPRLGHFYNKKDLSIAAYIYPPDKSWNDRSLNTIQDAIESAGQNWILTGNPILFREIKSSIITGSTMATIAALLFNLIIIYWFFKRTIHVLLVILPVIIGFLLTPGVMGHLNSPFNFINIGTIALIFGLGVDYGIYVMQAYLMEEKKDIANALRITGKNVMVCAATTVAGCGSLLTAKFSGIASIGLVLTIGAISCAVIALLILPALLYLTEDRL